MSNSFVLRLEHGAALTDDDRAGLSRLLRRPRTLEPRQVLCVEGDHVPRIFVVLAGWACRYRMLEGGQRQVTDLLLPGDICHLHTGLLDRTDHALGTLTACTAAEVDPAEVSALVAALPNAARALWWSSLQTDSVLREAVVNIGARRADQRLAHLVCEIAARLRAIGLVQGDGQGFSLAWPLTQTDVGEVASMTPVHANRTLRDLRRAGLLAVERRTMRVPDPARLVAFCGFRPEYLHLAPARLGPTAAAA